MEQPKRISLNNSVSWCEGYDQLVDDDDWDTTDDLLENESFLLEEQTAVFLPPPPSLIERSETDADARDAERFLYNHKDEILTWEQRPFFDNDDHKGLRPIADQRAYYYHHKPFFSTALTDSWEERRRKLASSMERSKTTRSWIESNIKVLYGQNTREAMLKTLHPAALMKTSMIHRSTRPRKRKHED